MAEEEHAESVSHDIPMAEHLRSAVAADWEPAPPMPHPSRPDVAPHAARRRAAISRRFPGRAIVVPAGSLKVRANDTDYSFRAASSFTWLTGETVADAVLVMTPNGAQHDAVLYIGVYAQPGEEKYFTSRTHGAVWVGNAPSVDDTEKTLGIATRPRSELARDLAAWRSERVALLRGFDASVDALFPNGENVDLARELDELRLVKD